jgi:hypothetical protein
MGYFVSKYAGITLKLKKPLAGLKKLAGLLHRTATTAYSCYLPVLGGFSRSWSCKTCRCKCNV